MKYIKRFNEELEYNIYDKAASGLRNLGHFKRADELEKHSKFMKDVNMINKLIENVNKYSPFGIYDAGVNDLPTKYSPQGAKLKEKFAIKIWFDDWHLSESFSDYNNDYSDSFSIRLSIGLLPIIEKKYDPNDNPITRLCDYTKESFWGTFNGPDIYINMKIEDNKIELVGFYIEEDNGDYTLSFLGRESGLQIKNTLVKIFSDEKFNFPYDGDKYNTLQECLRYNICEILPNLIQEANLTIDSSFEFSDIGEFIKKQGINKFYRTFDFVN